MEIAPIVIPQFAFKLTLRSRAVNNTHCMFGDLLEFVVIVIIRDANKYQLFFCLVMVYYRSMVNPYLCLTAFSHCTLFGTS